jgi:hypothetical protein
MPANRTQGKTLSYRAFRKARAAYARAVQDFSESMVAPTVAARIALDDMGIPAHQHFAILQKVWLCVRPGARRVLDNMHSADQEF